MVSYLNEYDVFFFSSKCTKFKKLKDLFTKMSHDSSHNFFVRTFIIPCLLWCHIRSAFLFVIGQKLGGTLSPNKKFYIS